MQTSMKMQDALPMVMGGFAVGCVAMSLWQSRTTPRKESTSPMPDANGNKNENIDGQEEKGGNAVKGGLENGKGQEVKENEDKRKGGKKGKETEEAKENKGKRKGGKKGKETEDNDRVKMRKACTLRYLTEFITLACARDMMRMQLFPNAKEVSESMGCYNAVRKFLRVDKNDDTVTVVVIGDGETPRTAAVFAMLSKWKVYSVDPIMKQDTTYEYKTGSDLSTLDRVVCIPKKIEEIRITMAKAVIVMMHAHVSIEASMKACEVTESLIGLVACPCCNFHERQSKLFGRLPSKEYEDRGVWSPHRNFRVWDTLDMALTPWWDSAKIELPKQLTNCDKTRVGFLQGKIRLAPHGSVVVGQEQVAHCQRFIDEYKPSCTEPGVVLKNSHSHSSLVGTFISRRRTGKRLVFFTMQVGEHVVQVICNNEVYNGTALTGSEGSGEEVFDWTRMSALVRNGDTVRIHGYPGLSKGDTFSMYATGIQLLRTKYDLIHYVSS